MFDLDAARLDAGAKALRELDMAGKLTVPWDRVPKAKKRKWWAKASVVLEAAKAVVEPIPKG